jgi:hypothetical protein
MDTFESQSADKKESIEKPAALYHASRSRAIKEFEPRADKTRSDEDGPLVFATPDKAYASVFLIPWDDSWVQCINHDGVVTLVVSDQERFCAEDKGGAIYELASDNFSNVEPGTDHPEWTSAEKVKPRRIEEITSAVDAMIENGVQLYFVDHATFDRIHADTQNFGLDILKTLKSENERRTIKN